MIKIEKRLYTFCEECEEFSPCSMKLREKLDDNSYVTKAVIMCSHSETCINAVNQYKKHKENRNICKEGD